MFVSFRHENALKLEPGEWVSFNQGVGDSYPGTFVAYIGRVVRTEDYDAVVRIEHPASAKGKTYKVGYIRLVRVFPPLGTEPADDAVGTAEGITDFEPTIIQRQAWAAFQAELPQLLEHSSGKWVAYHGYQRVALADTKLAVYAEIGDTYPLTEIMVVRVDIPGPPVNLARPRRVHRG